MNFTKMQGAGNDYVLIETSDASNNWPEVALTVCDRHFGIGADSLLLLMPSKIADFKMRILDSDGSEAEACGNGTRCLAKYVYEKGLLKNGAEQALIETNSGIRTVRYYKQEGQLVEIQANMGKPEFVPENIPVKVKPGDKINTINYMLSYPVNVQGNELTLNCISMGNPHAVHFCETPVKDFSLDKLGPKVERKDIFPNRVNFEVARIINRQLIEARVWERGVGETLACGSGACAITIAAHLLGYVEKKVDITLPGGTLKVEWNGNREVLLSGPAEIVYTGYWPD